MRRQLSLSRPVPRRRRHQGGCSGRSASRAVPSTATTAWTPRARSRSGSGGSAIRSARSTTASACSVAPGSSARCRSHCTSRSNARKRKGSRSRPRPASPPAFDLARVSSEFALVDGEERRTGRVSAPRRQGLVRAGQEPVRAPVAGVIIEALIRPTTTGQVFGGCVKIEATREACLGLPSLRSGQGSRAAEGGAGQVVARVTPWRTARRTRHIEVWKNRDANYRFERMEDPMKYFKAFK